MDEATQAIVAACEGMSEEDVLALIQSSTNAEAFADPGLIAAYVAHLAGGGSAA
jgi:hypothetical protein